MNCCCQHHVRMQLRAVPSPTSNTFIHSGASIAWNRCSTPAFMYMCIASVKAPLVEWYASANYVSCNVELSSALVVMVCCIWLRFYGTKLGIMP